jgi:hypothetical protein
MMDCQNEDIKVSKTAVTPPVLKVFLTRRGRLISKEERRRRIRETFDSTHTSLLSTRSQ